MARVSVLGLGRVGLATGVGFASQGHDVFCFDIDPVKFRAISSGKQPYRENALGKAFNEVFRKGRLNPTDDIDECLRDSKFYMICVGTPSAQDGSMDSSFIKDAAETIGGAIRRRKDYPVVAVKSTVVPGTTEKVVLPTIKRQSRLPFSSFGMCMNPEFLREGTAFEDTMKPDRIVIGSNGAKAGDSLEKLYSGFKSIKWRCDIATAEMVKYASNSFLATKVTFANEIANLCERFDLDSDKVLEGMALDSRIGRKFLVPGAGFGGPCLPKDLRAIIFAADKAGYESRLLSTVMQLNEAQSLRVVEILQEEVGSLKGKRVAVLGLAFKPDTDDSRDSRAIPIINALLKRKATVVVHDPVVSLSSLGVNLPVRESQTAREALLDADGCIIQTAWREYTRLGESDFRVMRNAVVVDGRRTLAKSKLPAGVVYRRIG